MYVPFLSDVMDSFCFLLSPQFSYINLSGTDGLKYTIIVGQGCLWGMKKKKNKIILKLHVCKLLW